MQLGRGVILVLVNIVMLVLWTTFSNPGCVTVVVKRNAIEEKFLQTLSKQTDPVVHYSIPQASVTRKDNDGNDVVFYKYQEKQCMGGTDLDPVDSLEEALTTCAKKKVCQSISCHNITSCRITSPSCILKTSEKDKYYAYVAISRTPKRLHLYEKLISDLPPTEALRNATGRRIMSGETHSKNITWNPQADFWKGELRRNRTDEIPYIEVTRLDHITMGPLVSVDPVHKIAFFRMPKVQSSNLFRLYDRLVGHTDIIEDEKGHIWMHERFRENDPFRERISFKDLDKETCNRIMNDPSYRKVVFFRDPVDRILSCYLDKFKRKHYATFFGQEEGTTTFPQLLQYVDQTGPSPYGVGPGVNYHYQAQVLTSNLYKFLPLFDFIGWGNNAHTKQMLEKYNLWEKFGAKTWPHGFMKSGDNHTTGSKDKKDLYINESTTAMAKHAYDIDYHFFRHIGLVKDGPPVSGKSMVSFFSHCQNKQRVCWPMQADP